MKIGRDWWGIVDADAPGVPRGMHWGDVDEFKELCEQEGLVLGWSLSWENFVIMENPAPGKWVFLMHCRQGGLGSDLIPLTRKYWDAIVYLWDRMKNVPATHTIGMIAAIKKEADDERRRALMAEQEETRNDVMESLWLERGYRTPKVAPLPKKITLMSQHRKRLRKKRRQKILIP